MSVWFTSDLHLGHGLVAGYRGFEDVRTRRLMDEHSFLVQSATAEHDTRLATNWDRMVDEDDIVWILGDLTVSTDVLPMFDWIRARPGRKHLVLGNHDAIHPAHRDAQKRYAKAWDRSHPFDSIQTFARRRVGQGRRQVLLSHFPYSAAPDHHREDNADFYAQYRLRDLGIPVLHGHTHRPEQTSHSELATPQFHVGLDAHDLRPVHLSKIEEWLES